MAIDEFLDSTLDRIRKGHPRLVISNGRIQEVRRLIDQEAIAKKFYVKVKDLAEQVLGESTVEYRIPDGLRLLSQSRKCLFRTYVLAAVYRLEGDERYQARAVRELRAAAAFPDWNPRHFLDTAEMTHAFAIGYDWFFSSLSDEEKAIIRNAIVEKGLKPALQAYETHGWWTRCYHNWNQVCNGGIGIGALAIADEEPEISRRILRYAIESLKRPVSRFDPDGGWAEGPGYWNYATTYNVLILSALDTALETDFGLSEVPGFSETGMFPIYMTGPLMKTFNYADGGEHTLRSPQMFWLSKKFNKPVYAWYEREVASPHPLDLLWFSSDGDPPNAEDLPLNRWFRNVDVVTFRSSWEDPKGIFVGFKGGDNSANHSHLDLGTFILDVSGYRWVVDLGADNYNMPGYFGDRRWTYYRLRTEGHNTLTLNGQNQNPSAKAPITSFVSSARRGSATADLKAAYPKYARKLQRTVSLIDSEEVKIEDEIQTVEPVKVEWHVHTPATVEIWGNEAVLIQEEEKLKLEVLEPEDITLQKCTLKLAAPQSPIEGVSKVTLRPERRVTSTRIVVRFQMICGTGG